MEVSQTGLQRQEDMSLQEALQTPILLFQPTIQALALAQGLSISRGLGKQRQP